eukprot:356474-Rhodomonas_salina.1
MGVYGKSVGLGQHSISWVYQESRKAGACDLGVHNMGTCRCVCAVCCVLCVRATDSVCLSLSPKGHIREERKSEKRKQGGKKEKTLAKKETDQEARPYRPVESPCGLRLSQGRRGAGRWSVVAPYALSVPEIA